MHREHAYSGTLKALAFGRLRLEDHAAGLPWGLSQDTHEEPLNFSSSTGRNSQSYFENLTAVENAVIDYLKKSMLNLINC